MGWFWESSSRNDGKRSNDPLGDLDPSLRDFLAKESPVKYNTSNTPSPRPAPPSTSLPDSQSSTTSPVEDSTPKAPSQSLYKDGRYADLWKTYQSQNDVEAANKTDQEKISDVLEGYKQRKAEIGRAALENCSLEQWDVNDCFRNGGWASRLTMCRDENRKLERCYMMQAKFLKALGYLSTYDRPAEVDEQIQMHADTLYHRMLDQEQLMETAKAEGKPTPIFPPLLSTRVKLATTTSSQSQDALENNRVKVSDLPAKIQSSLNERLNGLNNEERELEERAIKAEIQAGEQVAESLGSIFKKQDEEKRIRKEQGKETIGDKVSSIFGYR